MRSTIIFGGPAGQGPNLVTNLVGKALVNYGYYVFYYRDYQSLIRGGHNFNRLTFSDKPVNTNDETIDVLVCLDARTKNEHKKDVHKNTIILEGKRSNVYFAGRVFKLLGLPYSTLDEQFKKLKRRYEENTKEAKAGYEEETRTLHTLKKRPAKNRLFINGSQGLARGAIAGGIDLYFGYPMTPSTPLLTILAGMQDKHDFAVVEMENELSVVNTSVGAAITGAKVMTGSSGGGFDLMTETLSLMGMAEVPMVIHLAQRMGPATGVPTYTSQGDLQVARHAGHGEFFRLVVAPGDPQEAEELVSQAFLIAQQHATPCIVVTDKHLAECYYTTEGKAKVVTSKKMHTLKRWNGYESDAVGSATESAEIITKNVERRLKKQSAVRRTVARFSPLKTYGAKTSKDLVVFWGSTKGALIDVSEEISAKFIQVRYIEPFPLELKKELDKARRIVVVENNATGQLADIIQEQIGHYPKMKRLLRYDGRPFTRQTLTKQLKEALK